MLSVSSSVRNIQTGCSFYSSLQPGGILKTSGAFLFSDSCSVYSFCMIIVYRYRYTTSSSSCLPGRYYEIRSRYSGPIMMPLEFTNSFSPARLVDNWILCSFWHKLLILILWLMQKTAPNTAAIRAKPYGISPVP